MMDRQEGFGGPVNPDNPVKLIVLELAELVLELTGSKSKTVFCPLPQGDFAQRKPVIDLAKKGLGWEPKIAPREELEKIIARFDMRLKNQGGKCIYERYQCSALGERRGSIPRKRIG